MSAFAKLKIELDANWTTILVGWKGLGVLSPWPDRWTEFSPLLSSDEIAVFAEERLDSSLVPMEQDLIAELLSCDLRTESRGAIVAIVKRLSDLSHGNEAFELRKWRLVLLEELLENIPQDPVSGLTALSEFWQNFGFPSDSPHIVQGRGNSITPLEYYQPTILRDVLVRHLAWIENEKMAVSRLGKYRSAGAGNE